MSIPTDVQAIEAEFRELYASMLAAFDAQIALEGNVRAGVGEDEITAHPRSPQRVIAHIFAVSRLSCGDYARCARVSHAFRRPAERELPYTAELGIMKSWDELNIGSIWAYLEPDALAPWRRLQQPAIAAGTEELRIGLAQGGDVRFHPSSGERIARDELEEVTGEMIIDKVDLEALVTSMPKLHTLDIDWYGGAFTGDDAVSIGRLEAVRSLSLPRWQPGLIIAAPGLVYLGVALDGGPVGLPVEACPPVKKVYITAFGYDYSHVASSATLPWQGSTEWDALKAICDERGISINL
ncbi:hypothetical protein JCM10450v2_002132 [Rhodotorula kratochvilovae]